ncbi:MAG: signal peptidase I [Candidatus Levybacteria bacterium]|nr:signal peptidase I [Candidatus Levybacteria bacterium]
MELFRKAYFFLLDILQTLILAAAAFVVVYMFLFRPFEVKGESMYPNFHDSQYLITNIISLKLGDPKLGDVVVFKAPNDPEKDFIKRVIGVGGDQVSIRDGQVYLNGKLLDENKYLKPSVKTYGGSFLKEGQAVSVPQGYFFVLGDNRSYSSDSREWGFVPKKNIIGSSFFIYWPITGAGIIKNPY